MPISTLLWLMTAAMVALMAWSLRRAPLRAALDQWLVPAATLLAGGVAHLVAPGVSGAVAFGTLLLLGVAPTLAMRRASHALRWGRIGAARRLAALAYGLHPFRAQRTFRKAVEISWRLSRGEALDLAAEVEGLGVDSPLERAAHTLALASWTNDFEGMAGLLASQAIRGRLAAMGLGAIQITVAGETLGPAAVIARYHELTASGGLAHASLDAAWLLLTTAAQLGDVERVLREQDELARLVPPERVAFTLATAYQRAGRPAEAEAVIARALRTPMNESARRRLEHRRAHPLPPVAPSEAQGEVLELVGRRLDARRALAPFRLRLRRPAPLTWLTVLSLVFVFGWQAGLPSAFAYASFGLWAPFSRAPHLHRLLSYAWLHVDVWHLGLNLVGLVIFGLFVEHQLGRLRWLLVYVGSAVLAGVAFLLWQPGGVAVGASGAVFGLVGACVVVTLVDPALRSTREGRIELGMLGVLVVLQAVGDVFIAESAGSAHAGGLAAGFLVAALVAPRRVAKAPRPPLPASQPGERDR